MGPAIGKGLIVLGVAIAIIGVIVTLGGGKLFTWFGRLPGDIRIEGEGSKVFIPIVSCIVISIVLSLVMMLLSRFR